jgi:hypothetical protein
MRTSRPERSFVLTGPEAPRSGRVLILSLALGLAGVVSPVLPAGTGAQAIAQTSQTAPSNPAAPATTTPATQNNASATTAAAAQKPSAAKTTAAAKTATPAKKPATTAATQASAAKPGASAATKPAATTTAATQTPAAKPGASAAPKPATTTATTTAPGAKPAAGTSAAPKPGATAATAAKPMTPANAAAKPAAGAAAASSRGAAPATAKTATVRPGSVTMRTAGTPVLNGTTVTPASSLSRPHLEDRIAYQYNALGRRDPFQPLIDGGFVGNDVGGDAPPDVGGLKVVGIVWGASDKFALVEDARGGSFVLRPGDKVMNGVVSGLTRDALMVSITTDGQTESVAIPLTRKGDSNGNR